MALTVVDSGTLAPVTGENYITGLSPGATPAVFVAAFDFSNQAGCTFAVSIASRVPGSATFARVYRSDNLVVAVGASDGLLTPPVPVDGNSDLYVHLVTGTSVSMFNWAVYKLA
jgi:hypothetical protein